MLSRLETFIVYSCIWSVTLAKSIVPRKTWRKLWHSCISFNLLLTNQNLSPITFRLPWWKNIENLTCILVKNNLEMQECHNLIGTSRTVGSAKKFVRITSVLVEESSRRRFARYVHVKNLNFLFYCSNIAKSENAMLWRMLSRLETCIVYSNVVYQNRSPQAGKRENWQFVDLSRLQFTSDESEFIPDYI
jgi:hypothetical protein